MRLVSHLNWCLPCVALLAGCSTHEGNFGAEPDSAPPKAAAKTQPAEVKPVAFRYAPDKSEYHYAVFTTQTPTGGTPQTAELDFTVKVAHTAKGFTNESTIQSVTDNGVAAPGAAAKMKLFRCTTTLDGLGKVLHSSAVGSEGLMSPGVPDLGSSFTLPAKPLLPGASWSETVTDSLGKYVTTYTFVGVETVGNQRIATFEKNATGDEGAHTVRPTTIKVDADTGVLVNRMADITMNTTTPGKDIMVRFETKLK